MNALLVCMLSIFHFYLTILVNFYYSDVIFLFSLAWNAFL
jgi:hypothetical protein